MSWRQGEGEGEGLEPPPVLGGICTPYVNTFVLWIEKEGSRETGREESTVKSEKNITLLIFVMILFVSAFVR